MNCSTPNCPNFPSANGKCHDCIEESMIATACRCKVCNTYVAEFSIPYCPTCKQTGDFDFDDQIID